MSKVIEVNEGTWDQEVLKNSGLVMVDFWAVWCGPCKMVSPMVDELSKEYEGRVKVAKLNTDESPGVASRYQIMGIPTLLFFKDGEPVDKIVGAAPKKQYQDKIEALLA